MKLLYFCTDQLVDEKGSFPVDPWKLKGGWQPPHASNCAGRNRLRTATVQNYWRIKRWTPNILQVIESLARPEIFSSLDAAKLSIMCI